MHLDNDREMPGLNEWLVSEHHQDPVGGMCHRLHTESNRAGLPSVWIFIDAVLDPEAADDCSDRFCMMTKDNNNLLQMCLKGRMNQSLNDWNSVKMLNAFWPVAETRCGTRRQ